MELNEAKEIYSGIFIKHKIGMASFMIFFDESKVENLNAYANYKSMLQEEWANFNKIRVIHKNNFPEMLRSYVIILKEYKKERKKDNFFFLQKLIKAYSKIKFPKKYQDLYEEACDFLEKRIDFFCSYTTRGVLAINKLYEIAIWRQYCVDDSNVDWHTTNYLAKMIVRFFNDHGLNYFFDRESLVNGDLIEESIYYYCDKAIVLVQILQHESFRDNERETNWCYNEYCRYKGTNDIKYIFYKIPEIAKPVAARSDIEKWYDYVSTPKGVLSTTINSNWDNERIRYQVNLDAKIIKAEREKQFDKILAKIKE